MTEATVVRVYTLETGCYSDRGLAGVFPTVEAAKTVVMRGKSFTAAEGADGERRPMRKMKWRLENSQPYGAATGREWINNGDWESAASIREWAVPVVEEHEGG